MRSALGRIAAVGGAVAVLLLAVPAAASAHPLGNFTVNRYSGIVVATDRITVDHVLDLAEIPTAQRMPGIDTDGNGRPSATELATYAAATCGDAVAATRLDVAGQPVRLDVLRSAAQARAGQAGLPTLRVECALQTRIAPLTGTVRVRFVDEAADDEIGWREVTARGDGTTVLRSDVPQQSESKRLTAYPRDLLKSPLDERGARLEVRSGGARLQPGGDTAAAGAPGVPLGGRLTAAFQGLVTRYDGSLPLMVLAVLAATLLGAAHAVAPGHGKTVMAFYLSGRRDGALRAAATVGATVTATHTAGVLLLGLLVSAGTAFAPARLYPWLTLVSGLLVATVGATLLREAHRPPRGDHGTLAGHAVMTGHAVLAGHPRDHQQRAHGHPDVTPHGEARERRSSLPFIGVEPRRSGAIGVAPRHHPRELADPPGHHHPHLHDHPPEHAQPPEHPHPHGGPSRRGLVAMGLAGGLLPSPSALVVFLGALALGHPWFGVLLVVFFGLGMALTLGVVGLAVLRLRATVEQRFAGRAGSRLATVVRLVPVLTAVCIVTVGLSVALKGIFGVGG
jgi:nickel/cobalt transporter (NicO) family protein